MQIQIADQRPPLSVAIGLAKKQSDPRLPQWETEMTQMVIEVTRKFHGSLTSENVNRGLETTVGILGLGLMNASGGRPDASAWLGHLQTHGIKKVSGQAVEVVKGIIALPRTDYLRPASSFDAPPREQLLYFAKAGYGALRSDEAARHRNRLHLEAAEWLLENTSIGTSAKRNLFAALKDNVTADDVFFYILPRMAEIPMKYLPEQYNIEDEGNYEDELDDFEGDAIKLPVPLWTKAKKRYEAFVKTMPEKLQGALVTEGETWFEVRVRRDWEPAVEMEEGVPEVEPEVKVAKKKPAAKVSKATKAPAKAAPKAPKAAKVAAKTAKTPKAAPAEKPKAKSTTKKSPSAKAR